MVTSQSVRSCSNSSCILSSHDHAWKKIMNWWDNRWWCHGRSAPAATHCVFCHYMTELKRRSWHAEMNEGDVTVSLFPQQIITNFVVTQPHLKEDCSPKHQQVSNQQPSNPRTLFRHGQATPSPSIPTVTPLHPAPPPLPPPPPLHTAALTFSMAAPTSCGNGPLLPMQVMQP